jgi:hypothetical protein
MFHRSPFYRSSGNTTEEESLECKKDYDDWDYGDGCHRQEIRPVNLQLTDKVSQRLLDCLFLVVGDDDQRPEIIVPSPHKTEDCNGGYNRLAHGKNDAEED